MARQKKKKKGGGSDGWLVTFSDLMTLLLTFFVLLLSMSSMDRTLLTRISPRTQQISNIDLSGQGKVPDRIQLMLELLKEPDIALDKLNRFKDLLFPNELLPPELSEGFLDANLQILSRPEGVVIVLTDALLFPSGEYRLSTPAKSLLSAIVPVLHYSSADANISGFADTDEAGGEAYAISSRRAIAVLEYFLQNELVPARFSVSGYGADKPLHRGTSPEMRAKNRRVEILLKTTQWLGRYQ